MSQQPKKAGYKQTEVGLIPEDWDVIELQQIVVTDGLVRGPFGGALKKEFFVKDGYKVYEQRNAIYETIEKGNYFIDDKKYSELSRFRIEAGNLIVSCSGTIGRIFEIPKNPPAGVINQALLNIKLDKNLVNSKFFVNIFKSTDFQERIIDNTHGGAMQNLVGMDVFRKTLIPLPPTKAEQEAIATALSDADALIESLEQLIAKKRDIKHGAMQELLIGARRLPGFSGEWETKRLGDVATLKSGYAFKSEAYSVLGNFKIVTISNVQDGYMDLTEYNTITELPSDIQNHQILKRDDLLISMTGNVGRVCKVNSDDCLLNQRVGKIETHNKKEFLYQFLRQELFMSAMISKAKGGAQGNLSVSDITEYEVMLPPLEEQTAIAQVLSEMDTELSALEAQLNKARQLKQGMMQVLLTGAVRLVPTPKFA